VRRSGDGGVISVARNHIFMICSETREIGYFANAARLFEAWCPNVIRCWYRSAATAESAMDEDRVNMEIRAFLKEVGVTSQREIERAARAALDKGAVTVGSTLKPRMTLQIPEIGFEHIVEGDIELS
jgi:hypothetical protein